MSLTTASSVGSENGISDINSECRSSNVVRALWKPVQWLLGTGLCTSFLGAFVVVGWAQRSMQRYSLKTWWHMSPLKAGDVSWGQFSEMDASTASLRHWPNWCLGSTAPSDVTASWIRLRLRRCLGSLATNIRLGIQAAFNTWVITGPACFLWATAWYFGWQNSFNKGYENAAYGPVTFLLGMVLFSVAMLHLPLALARQASTGDWRRFYDFRLVWRLSRRRWMATLTLAAVWAAAAGLGILLKIGPQYIAGFHFKWIEVAADDALLLSRWIYAFAALILFPAYVLTRLFAARVYARSLIEGYQLGVVDEEELGENEWQALRRLGLLTPRQKPLRSFWVRAAAWLATRSGRLTAVAAIFFLWMSLAFGNLTSEFFARSDFSRGWWNLPMIHLPWFDYTPRHLSHPPQDYSI